jgi:hypothetical protein
MLPLFSRSALKTEGLVPGVGGGLASETHGCGLSCGACILSCGGRFASVTDTIADEAGDDYNVESGAMGELGGVGWLKGVLLAAIEAGAEDDTRVGARSKVEGARGWWG